MRAHARAHRERHLHHLVERGLVAGRAERAVILARLDRLERGAGIENAAAARAQHVPGEIEQAQARRMQEGRDQALRVEPGLGREIRNVDAVEVAILSVPDQPLDRIRRIGVGRLPQHREKVLDFTHDAECTRKRRRAKDQKTKRGRRPCGPAFALARPQRCSDGRSRRTEARRRRQVREPLEVVPGIVRLVE